ncbi:hypothetical protein ACMC5U_10070 [Deferribacteres bacterium DY0609]
MTALGCVAKQIDAPENVSLIPNVESPPSPAPKLLSPPPPVYKTEIAEYDPMDDTYVTLDSVEESLSSILYMIASEAGLNLIISPDINVKNPFTITVNNMPARDALDIIAENTGIYYEVTGSSLKMLGSVTKTFKFPYVRMKTTQNSEIGGDVFGSAEANLRGDYSLKYENLPESSDVQTQIINSVHAIIFAGETEDILGSRVGETNAIGSGSGHFRGAEGYIFNRFTGILKVTTTPKKMKIVSSYMEDVIRELNKQVLIEAKLVEVTLNDTSAYGINWRGTADGKSIGLSLGTDGGAAVLPGGLTAVGAISSFDYSDWFAFMAAYGRVESVGNPRIRVMNGQSAMITSGQLKPFWEMERETDDDTDDVTVTYTRVTVLDGIMLGVTPHVKEDGTITLNIVPVFSDVEETPEQQLDENGVVVASYPNINLKEAGTVLNLESGSTVVMGGLISNVETEDETKVPLLGDVPFLGYLFKSKYKYTQKRELVIFLTATIISG